MNLYLSKTHSDEIDENPVEVGKLGILYGSKDEINKLCDFFSEVKEYLRNNDSCHLHFRDSFDEWNRDVHFDIEINVV
jgi:hypothetical protein